ncbi:unnamed protein product [Ambrosiozyma monospora]|uniref:Unnamed protein product n=1 Tax=Ambrosiozyma monospora TaxID=43982 RepID=A0ACB5U2U7_AMBMO|nr:unnamed protein product [Ambrosiozyma monospora]
MFLKRLKNQLPSPRLQLDLLTAPVPGKDTTTKAPTTTTTAAPTTTTSTTTTKPTPPTAQTQTKAASSPSPTSETPITPSTSIKAPKPTKPTTLAPPAQLTSSGSSGSISRNTQSQSQSHSHKSLTHRSSIHSDMATPTRSYSHTQAPGTPVTLDPKASAGGSSSPLAPILASSDAVLSSSEPLAQVTGNGNGNTTIKSTQPVAEDEPE